MSRNIPANYQVVFVAGDGAETAFTSLSSILRSEADPYHDPDLPHFISAVSKQIYGATSAPSLIRLGNGALGPTGVLRAISAAYIAEKGLENQIRMEWVANHSRYSQIALQAGVVDIAFTYERDEERRAVDEGWASVAGVFCHDHFVLVGPEHDPAAITGSSDIVSAFETIAKRQARFHTRGDGSTTNHLEFSLWDKACLPLEERRDKEWYVWAPLPPLEAVSGADDAGAYILVDRGTYLTALEQGILKQTKVFVEDGAQLYNTCNILIRSDEKKREILNFVEWLKGENAQGLVSRYGRDWQNGLAVFTVGEEIHTPASGELMRRIQRDSPSLT